LDRCCTRNSNFFAGQGYVRPSEMADYLEARAEPEKADILEARAETIEDESGNISAVEAESRGTRAERTEPTV